MKVYEVYFETEHKLLIALIIVAENEKRANEMVDKLYGGHYDIEIKEIDISKERLYMIAAVEQEKEKK
jgi:hypothetical protein